jgi:hypothetical protein
LGRGKRIRKGIEKEKLVRQESEVSEKLRKCFAER